MRIKKPSTFTVSKDAKDKLEELKKIMDRSGSWIIDYLIKEKYKDIKR